MAPWNGRFRTWKSFWGSMIDLGYSPPAKWWLEDDPFQGNFSGATLNFRWAYIASWWFQIFFVLPPNKCSHSDYLNGLEPPQIGWCQPWDEKITGLFCLGGSSIRGWSYRKLWPFCVSFFFSVTNCQRREFFCNTRWWNSNIFYVHPLFGEMIQFWLIFFRWVGSTTN